MMSASRASTDISDVFWAFVREYAVVLADAAARTRQNEMGGEEDPDEGAAVGALLRSDTYAELAEAVWAGRPLSLRPRPEMRLPSGLRPGEMPWACDWDEDTSSYVFDDANALFFGADVLLRRDPDPDAAGLRAALAACVKGMLAVVEAADISELFDSLTTSPPCGQGRRQ